MKLTAKASIQIQRSAAEVFEAIVDPDKMTQYFISESTGRLEEGKEIIWKFPEFPDECVVNQVKIEKDRSVSFVWDKDTQVRISLEAQPDQSVVVRVEEGEKELNEANLSWLISNAGGWANFLACMKAFIEYGIHLRKGAFEFLNNQVPSTQK